MPVVLQRVLLTPSPTCWWLGRRLARNARSGQPADGIMVVGPLSVPVMASGRVHGHVAISQHWNVVLGVKLGTGNDEQMLWKFYCLVG